MWSSMRWLASCSRSSAWRERTISSSTRSGRGSWSLIHTVAAWAGSQRQRPRRQVERELVAAGLDRRAADFQRAVQERREVAGLVAQLDAAAADAREVQQVVD